MMRIIAAKNTSLLYRCYFKSTLSSRAYLSTGNNVQRGPLGPRSQTRQQQQISRAGIVAQPGSERGKWPLGIIMAAEKSGALSIPSQKAVTVLEDFQALGFKPIQEFCRNHQIEPTTLSLLAKILLRTRIRDHNLIAQKLLFAASKLGDSAATFLLVKEAIKFGSLRNHSLIGPRRHLQTLADDGNLTAVYLAGQIYESEGNRSQAIRIYEMATSNLSNVLNGEKAPKNSLGDIWKAMSEIKASAGDYVGAETAIRKCALQYDDPWAYYELAKAYISPSSEDYENYMLKAAVSGEPLAAHELGLLYYKQSQGRYLTHQDNVSNGHAESLEKPRDQSYDIQGATTTTPKIKLEKGTQARDWFSVGAESDISISQLYLAVLLRAAGKANEGLTWLERASSSKQLTAAVPWLRSIWDSKDPIYIDTAWDAKHNAGKTVVMAHGEKIAVAG